MSASMIERGRRTGRLGSTAVLALALFGGPGAVQAQGSAPSAAVKPVRGCAALAATDLSHALGAATSLGATLADTPQGRFCHVTGTIAPAIGFEVDLPTTRWTGRFLLAGCGGLCGTIDASIGNAGGCRPALDGQFVVAASDLGHGGRMGSPDEGAFAADPQKRIDFAYRANHLTALAAKALIQAFYGHPQRYAYFSGCSDGGREALMEAERYPDDFDGISAGAPAMLFQVQNSIWHAWTAAANTRADGSAVLLAAKLPVLHAAVIAHCDALDGTLDGLLADPRACTPDPAWVRCGTGESDTSHCLTADEWAVAAKIYEGPTDAEGHRFLPGGGEPGSELQWSAFVPRDPRDARMTAGMTAAMAPVVLADATATDSDVARYPFTTAQFARVGALHPLNDATNPDLHPFAAHGGKLIMWHGWSDSSIAPMISVAYYEAVRNELGAAATDRFLRLFMLPGVGHCGGGDGYAQVDTLSALIAWTERGLAPTQLTAGRLSERLRGGPAGGADGRGGGGPEGSTSKRPVAPYAQPDQAPLASRPIYPFPTIARYSGQGDPKLAGSYGPGSSPVGEAAVVAWYGAALIAPGFQKSYAVEGGKLVPMQN